MLVTLWDIVEEHQSCPMHHSMGNKMPTVRGYSLKLTDSQVFFDVRVESDRPLPLPESPLPTEKVVVVVVVIEV